MKIYIKPMTSQSCIRLVKTALEEAGIRYEQIELGEVTLPGSIEPIQHTALKSVLSKLGFEVVSEPADALIERVKGLLIRKVNNEESLGKKFSTFLAKELHYSYPNLSRLFSHATGMTIEHYIIALKIERVKAMLLDDRLNLTEISYRLNYSSVAHLSKQFKLVTGMSPSCFVRDRGGAGRRAIGDIGKPDQAK